jgi:general stress protein YciG
MAQEGKSGTTGTSNRGFASMDPAMQREIASKGGRSVPPEERSFSKDRALAAEAGRTGGEASHGGRRAAGAQPPDTGTPGRAPGGIDPEGGTGGTASGGDRTGGSGRKEGSR